MELLDLDELFKTQMTENIQNECLKSESERIKEYELLFDNLCTMDPKEGLAAMKALSDFKLKEPTRLLHPIRFNDGKIVSIQASAYHNCHPSLTLSKLEDYESFEVKTNFAVEKWGYGGKDRIYSYVPKNDLKKLIIKLMINQGRS